MDIKNALLVAPALKAVETDLQVVETICGYANEKTPLKNALQEVSIMSGWSVETILASCRAVMETNAELFEGVKNDFDSETDSSIEEISLEPFKNRFDEEMKEQNHLKEISSRVIEIASKLALALNIPVPASEAIPSGVSSTPRKSFAKALKNAFFTDENSKAQVSAGDPGWLTEPLLEEGDSDVQKLILLNNKMDESKSPDAVRQFAAKFKLSDADLAGVVLDVLDEARKQVVQSERIITNVTKEYGDTEKLLTVILEVMTDVNLAKSFVTGR